MGNDIYTYILLTGDLEQIDHFINHHQSDDENYGEIWDCKQYLQDKQCIEFIQKTNEENNELYSTGGRCKSGMNSKDKAYLALEGKYAFCENAITILSKYYDNLTIHLDYRDEDFEIGIGWLVIKNGIVLAGDYISLSRLDEIYSTLVINPYHVINTISLYGESDEVDTCISGIDTKVFINYSHNENIITATTTNTPWYEGFITWAKANPAIQFNITYKGIFKTKYYGYVVIEGGDIIADEFISLDTDDNNGMIDYYKYDSLSKFLEEVNF
jgi:hypothetical protein